MVNIGRRALLAGTAGALLAACAKRPVDPRALRLGLFPNLTHGPALTGVSSGRIAAALPGARLSTTLFNAGPAAMSALLARAVDASFVGPAPAASAFLRSHGRALKVVSGACSGGAALVVRRGGGVRAARDLRGRRVGTPQLGGTQDIALRRYLRTNGMVETTMGGDVTVVNMESPNLLSLFRQGTLDAAWVAEPWVSRLVGAGGEVLVDERDLWPRGEFATTLLVVHADYLRGAPRVVDALVDATAAEILRARAAPDRARTDVGDALRAITGVPVAPAVLQGAFSRMRFTADPLRDTVRAMVGHAQDLGMFPQGELDGLFDEARTARAVAATG